MSEVQHYLVVVRTDVAAGHRPSPPRLGIVLQSCRVQPELTVAETVALYAVYYPGPRPVEETIELVGLADERSQRAGKLSGGQQRRLDVAVALVGRPELLFLDEPTTGSIVGPPSGLVPHRRPARPGRHRVPHHPLPGGGRGAGRPGGHRPRR